MENINHISHFETKTIMTDPKKPIGKKLSGRVYKDGADQALQKRMEGKDTPFQRALRAAEAAGERTFVYNGKLYAARSFGGAVPQTPKKAQGIPPGGKVGEPGPTPMKKVRLGKGKTARPNLAFKARLRMEKSKNKSVGKASGPGVVARTIKKELAEGKRLRRLRRP